MNFSIIIPNYNGEKVINDCLKSLKIAIKNCRNIKTEIIVVDNGSTDNSILKIENYKLKIISLKRNYGFGYAINRGVDIAKYEYLIILNNDIVFDKNWLANIVKAINNNPDYACYYGLVMNRDGSQIESTGIKFYNCGKAINIINIKQETPYEIWGCPASLVVYKKEVFQKLGGFDEKYFAYIEDVDLAYRLSQNKYKTLFVPAAIAYHIGGATASKIKYLREYMTFKNWYIFIFKNYPFSKILFNLFPIILERFRNLKYLLVKLVK